MQPLLGFIGSYMSCDDFKLSSGEKLSIAEIIKINRILTNHMYPTHDCNYTFDIICVNFSKYTIQ